MAKDGFVYCHAKQPLSDYSPRLELIAQAKKTASTDTLEEYILPSLSLVSGPDGSRRGCSGD